MYDAIEASLREQKFKRIFAKDTERFIRNSENTELDKFISQHKGSEKNVGPVQKNDGQQFQRLFVIRNEGGMTALVQDGKGYILRLNKKESRNLPAFSKMIDIVTKDYEQEKAYQLLKNTLEQTQRDGLLDQQKPQFLGGKIEKTHFINPEDSEKMSDLIKNQGYPENFILLTKPGQSVFDMSDKGGVLVRLDELNNEKINGYSDHKIMVEGFVHQGIQRLFVGASVASLFRTATIKVNKELIHGNNSL